MAPNHSIAVLVEYLHARGGTQRQALELAQALQARGWDVRVFTRVLSRTACYPELQQGLNIRAAQELREVSGGGGSPIASRLQTVLKLTGLRHLRDYALMARGARGWELALFAELDAFSPTLINPHDFGPAAWLAAAYGRTRGVPVLWQCNDPYLRWTHGLSATARPLRALTIALDRRRCRGIDTIVVLDSRVGAVVERRYGLAPRIVPSGASPTFADLPDKAASRRQFGLSAPGPVFLVLTLLNSPHRRVEDAIEAFAASRCGGTLFLVAPAQPENDYVRKIRALLTGCGVADRIVWYNKPLADEVMLKAVLAASDVLVFPNDQQTWGLAVIEAAMAGLALVVSRGAGASEILTEGETARLFTPMDRARLAQILRELAERPQERERLGEAAQQLMLRDYNWTCFAQRIERVAEEMT